MKSAFGIEHGDLVSKLSANAVAGLAREAAKGGERGKMAATRLSAHQLGQRATVATNPVKRAGLIASGKVQRVRGNMAASGIKPVTHMAKPKVFSPRQLAWGAAATGGTAGGLGIMAANRRQTA